MSDVYTKLRTDPDGRVILERRLTYEVDGTQTLEELQDKLDGINEDVVRLQQKAVEVQATINTIKEFKRGVAIRN